MQKSHRWSSVLRISGTNKFTPITLQVGKQRLGVQRSPQTLVFLLKTEVNKRRTSGPDTGLRTRAAASPYCTLIKISKNKHVPGAGHMAWGAEHGLDFSPCLLSSQVLWGSAQPGTAALPSTILMRWILLVASINRWGKKMKIRESK